MQSGITVNDDVRERFNEMRLKRQHRYIIYCATEDKSSVEVEKVGEREETFE